MLGELLPISDSEVSHATLRRHALAVGARLDQRVTEPDEYDWPESRRDPVRLYASDRRHRWHLCSVQPRHRPLSALRCCGWYRTRWRFRGEIRVDRSVAGEAEQFMKAALQANDWTTQTKAIVLADGADGLKNLV